MKYYIFSDFFLDLYDLNLDIIPEKKNDFCIIAGNMCNFENYEKFDNYLCSFSKKFKNVFIVNGLHEYNSQILNVEDCKNIYNYFEKCYKNIKFLNDSYIINDGTLIYGSTLWDEENTKLNSKSKFFLQDALSVSIINNYKIIVITNVPPIKSCSMNGIHNNLDYYFKYNNLFDYWIYGCSKVYNNFFIDETHLITNPYIISKNYINLDVFIEL
jgi:hypothetical protein